MLQEKIFRRPSAPLLFIIIQGLLLMGAILLSCNNGAKNDHLTADNARLQRENDSIKNIRPVEQPANQEKPQEEKSDKDAADAAALRAGFHPISLQWLGWDKAGRVEVKPAADGWYSITGGQFSAKTDYLKIEGKVKRLSEKELEFDGTIETKISTINGGESCIRKGPQRFFGKGSRTYFRLQQMENCEGGNLVDYVDIYPGTSSL